MQPTCVMHVCSRYGWVSSTPFGVPFRECSSFQLPFELRVQIPIQLLLELEANLLDQNVNELEFELPI